jgi:septal ring factor EnvC (AmiA/AmiB activator)
MLAVTGETGSTVAVWVALIALAGSLATAAVTWVIARRKALDERTQLERTAEQARELGLIHASQDSLLELIDTQRTELANARTELAELRAHVTKMRGELATALRQHAECEEMRARQNRMITTQEGVITTQEKVISELRVRLGGVT